MLTKKINLTIFFITLWIIFSIGYIGYDQWFHFKERKLTQAYNKGVADSVRTIIDRAEKCKQVPLFADKKQINIISVNCLSNPKINESTK